METWACGQTGSNLKVFFPVSHLWCSKGWGSQICLHWHLRSNPGVFFTLVLLCIPYINQHQDSQWLFRLSKWARELFLRELSFTPCTVFWTLWGFDHRWIEVGVQLRTRIMPTKVLGPIFSTHQRKWWANRQADIGRWGHTCIRGGFFLFPLFSVKWQMRAKAERNSICHHPFSVVGQYSQ